MASLWPWSSQWRQVECLREGRRVAAELATSSKQTLSPSGAAEGKEEGKRDARIRLSDGRNMRTPLLWGMETLHETVHDNYISLDAHVPLSKNERQQIRCLLAKWDQKLTLTGVVTGKSVLTIFYGLIWEKKWRMAVILSMTLILAG